MANQKAPESVAVAYSGVTGRKSYTMAADRRGGLWLAVGDNAEPHFIGNSYELAPMKNFGRHDRLTLKGERYWMCWWRRPLAAGISCDICDGRTGEVLIKTAGHRVKPVLLHLMRPYRLDKAQQFLADADEGMLVTKTADGGIRARLLAGSHYGTMAAIADMRIVTAATESGTTCSVIASAADGTTVCKVGIAAAFKAYV